MRTLGIVLCLLAGCAGSKTLYLPDGRQGHSISCGGSAMSWEGCYTKAGDICRSRGYDIISKEGESTPTVTGSQYGVLAGANVSRVLVIACK